MHLRGDQRGQSIQIGAVLLFAVLVIAFVSYQATVVPDQNRAVEIDHSQSVRSDMVAVRNTILATAATGQSTPAAVDLGVRYPPRAIAINPPPSSGSLRTVELSTTEPNEVAVENAVATDSEAADYWDGAPRAFPTKGLAYEPSFTYYDGAPTTVYEQSVLYSRFPRGGDVLETGQTLVDGRSITLVALQGDRSVTGSRTATIDPQSVSAPVRTVTVEDDGGPVTVRLVTQLPRTAWVELLDAQIDGSDSDPDAYIDSISCVNAPPDPCGTLSLTFEPGVVYELRLGAVGFGGTPDPALGYAVAVEGDEATIPEGGAQRVVVEVRDEYDNPVSGIDVAVGTPPGQGSLTPVSSTTDDAGQAVFRYEAPNNVNSATTATFTLGFDGPDSGNAVGGSNDREVAEFDVTVTNADGSGGGGGDTTAPTISNFDLSNPSGDDLDVSFDSDEQLSDITVEVTDSNSNVVATLTAADFTESGSGPYAYETTYTVASDGTYTATLTRAADAAGNDGASGQSDTVTVGGSTTNQAPTVDSFQTNNPGNSGKIDVSWTVGDDDGNLQEVTVTIDDGSGTTMTKTRAASGTDDSDSVSFTGLDDGTYDVTITVTDTQGASDSETRQQDVSNTPGGGGSGNNALDGTDAPIFDI